LRQRLTEVRAGGGERARERHLARGKLLAQLDAVAGGIADVEVDVVTRSVTTDSSLRSGPVSLAPVLARKPIAGQLRRLLDSDLERFKTLVETTPPSEDERM